MRNLVGHNGRSPLLDRRCRAPSLALQPRGLVRGGHPQHVVRAWISKVFDSSRRARPRRGKGAETTQALASPTRASPRTPVGVTTEVAAWPCLSSRSELSTAFFNRIREIRLAIRSRGLRRPFAQSIRLIESAQPRRTHWPLPPKPPPARLKHDATATRQPVTLPPASTARPAAPSSGSPRGGRRVRPLRIELDHLPLLPLAPAPDSPTPAAP